MKVPKPYANIAQLAERCSCKAQVKGPTPFVGSNIADSRCKIMNYEGLCERLFESAADMEEFPTRPSLIKGSTPWT